jgi:pseudo-rSAM protein
MVETNKTKLVKLVKRLTARKNLLFIKLSNDFINENKDIDHFVKKIREYFMGDLIDVEMSLGKPIQMMPILNIQRDIDKIKKDNSSSVGEDVMDYLNEVTLYITNKSKENSSLLFKKAYKQFLFPINNTNKKELKFELIEALIKEIEYTSLNKINILGGNILLYSKLDKVINILNKTRAIKNYFFYYNDFKNNKDIDIRIFKNEHSKIKLFVDFSLDKKELISVLKLFNKSDINYSIIFIIQNEEEFEEAQKVILENNFKNYSFRPFFNENNLSFFKKYVFITKEMLFENKQSLKEIFAKMAMNPLQFGKVITLANGNIYANVNNPKLGKLDKDSLYNIFYKEMNSGKSWLRARKNVIPCKNCVYNSICPSISNYEYVIGRNNLCSIWKEN